MIGASAVPPEGDTHVITCSSSERRSTSTPVGAAGRLYDLAGTDTDPDTDAVRPPTIVTPDRDALNDRDTLDPYWRVTVIVSS